MTAMVETAVTTRKAFSEQRTHKIRPRVLLVDDDFLIADTAMNDLVDAGFDVVLRYNGKEGLATALAEPFDLVITDLMMPVMSGLEMIAALRHAGATMPIVLATAVSPASLPSMAWPRNCKA